MQWATGARELFNQRLLPPLTRKDADWAVAPYDQDRLGLKGHFNFDLDADENDKLHSEWPFEITKRTDPRHRRGRQIHSSILSTTQVLPLGKGYEMPKGEESTHTTR